MSSYMGTELVDEYFESEGTGDASNKHVEDEEIFEDAGIETLEVDPTKSFEVFAGRRYDPAERRENDSIFRQKLVKPSEMRASTSSFVKSLDNAVRKHATQRHAAALSAAIETPLQRYQRLLTEASELQQQLQSVADADKLRPAKATPINPDAGVWKTLVHGMQELQGRLQGMESDVASATLRTASAQHGAESLVHEKLAAIDSHTLTAAHEQPKSAPLVPAAASVSEIVTLDERLAVLEGAVVSDADGLQSRLDKLERRVAMLTPAGMASIKVLAQNAASAMKTAPTSGGAPSNAAVQTAIAKLRRWDTLGEALSLTVARLSTLQRYHQNTADLSKTIAHLHSVADKLETEISTEKEMLASLHKAIAETAATASANFTELRKRLERR